MEEGVELVSSSDEDSDWELQKEAVKKISNAPDVTRFNLSQDNGKFSHTYE